MKRKILCLAMVLVMLAGTTSLACNATVSAQSGYLFFATDGGSNLGHLKLPYGTRVNLDNYIPVKPGYDSDGWYAAPSGQTQRLTEVTLNENKIVWAKWKVKSGLSKQQVESSIVAREVIGNYVVIQTANGKTLIVPVSDRWVEQNARLEAMMEVYREKFK